MNSDCEKIKDQIADLVTGILPEAQVHELEQHLKECAACRDYARALKDEDMLLTEFFAKIDTNITHQQECVLQAINRSDVSKQIETHLIWRTIMKSPFTKIAAAAAIIIACFTGIFFWKSTGSGIALADVLARVEQVKVFSCKGSFTMTGQIAPGKPYQWEVRHTNLTSQEYGTKVSLEEPDPNGGESTFAETYFFPHKNTMIHIRHSEKKYTRTELDDAEVQRMQKELSRYNDPGAFLKEIAACKHESLGRSTIDGVDVEGFQTTDPNCRGGASGFEDPQVDVKVWVDVKTRLPVRYESLTSGLDQMGNTMSHRLVMHNFQWDVPVAAAEFEPPVIPDGYMVMVDKLPGPVNEETATKSLRQCVELLGKYPESISVAPTKGLQSELDKSDSPAAKRLKEELKGLTEQERVDRLMDAGTPMRCLSRFYVGLIDDRKDPAYYGRTVTPKDADMVLLRWKVSDNEYRVIFGDLRATTVTAEALAELEKVVSK